RTDQGSTTSAGDLHRFSARNGPHRQRRQGLTPPRPTNKNRQLTTAFPTGSHTMAFPRRYPPELIDAAVQRVADTRAVRAYGAVTTVARQLNLDPRLVQKWVSKATTPPQEGRAGDTVTDGREVLSPGLLHCRMCRQLMTRTDTIDAGLVYQCQPGCRLRPLNATAITDAVGRALRYATRILPATGAPTHPHLAAAHAHRVLARVTVGTTASDITLAWRATPTLPPNHTNAEQARRVATARDIAARDPLRARQLLHEILIGVDPVTAAADAPHAEAATLLAELHLRLDRAGDATVWAAYAHHSTAHLHGPTHPASLHALHLHATAQRRAGHHQRAYHLYRELAELLAQIDGPQAHRTLAIHATITLVLHDLGHCQAARGLLADTITAHRRKHPGHPATVRMTHHLARIADECASNGHEHAT
ncbi:hypothetical protein, partial [Micromonospora fulviviridis]|uniref:hypothetical protein n=1 Tax=Micromonospora fulviviridis TaxID=47860 RepID=UPI003787B495